MTPVAKPDEFEFMTLLGCTMDGYLWDIDPSTGATSNRRQTGLASLGDIACLPQNHGAIYTVTGWASKDVPNALYRIDPLTAATQLVGETGLVIDYCALAFDPFGAVLYGFGAVSDHDQTVGLFTIDINTGRATVVANVPIPPGDFSSYSGMMFDERGRLLMVDCWHYALVAVDKHTGAITTQLPLVIRDNSPLAGVRFGLAQKMYGRAFRFSEGTGPGNFGTYRLFTLDTANANLTPVGTFASAVNGISGMTLYWYG